MLARFDGIIHLCMRTIAKYLSTDEYNLPVSGIRVLGTTGSSATVTWEVNS